MSHLCKNCYPNKRWYPNSIQLLTEYLETYESEIEVEFRYELVRNLAYNIQYLEYLHMTLEQLNLSQVLVTQSYKSFIITCASILEGVLYYIVASKGLEKKIFWKDVKNFFSKEYKRDGKKYRENTILQVKIDSPSKKEMKFDALIKKAQSRKLLGDDQNLYAKINVLRKLRNRVHLQLIEEKVDTDWSVFDKSKFILANNTLYQVLTNEIFKSTNKQKKMFEFLKIE